MDRRASRDGLAGFSFRRIDGADRERRARDLEEPGGAIHAARIASGKY